jgi:hypothetical protein
LIVDGLVIWNLNSCCLVRKPDGTDGTLTISTFCQSFSFIRAGHHILTVAGQQINHGLRLDVGEDATITPIQIQFIDAKIRGVSRRRQ